MWFYKTLNGRLRLDWWQIQWNFHQRPNFCLSESWCRCMWTPSIAIVVFCEFRPTSLELFLVFINYIFDCGFKLNYHILGNTIELFLISRSPLTSDHKSFGKEQQNLEYYKNHLHTICNLVLQLSHLKIIKENYCIFIDKEYIMPCK